MPVDRPSGFSGVSTPASPESPVRFGVIGTNFISEWFVAACRQTGGRAAATAACSRDLRRAHEFAAGNGVADAFDDLAAMLAVVDAVYVASPMAAHHDQARQAVAAGKHVLVEKTMGTSLAQVRDLLTAASDAGVVAMEAVRNVHTPSHRLIRDALPRLGTLRYARLEKQQYSSRYDRFRAGEVSNAFDPATGNSALADIGIYCLQPALDLFGEPSGTAGASIRLANGFEAAGSLQLDYGSMIVDVVYSKITAGVTPSVIHGEDAALTIDDPGETSRVNLVHRDGSEEVLLDVPQVRPRDTLTDEILDFVDQVRAGATDPRWADLTMLSRRLMDDHLGQR